MGRPRTDHVAIARAFGQAVEAERIRLGRPGKKVKQEAAVFELLRRDPRRWGSRRTAFRRLALYREILKADRRAAERYAQQQRVLAELDRKMAELRAALEPARAQMDAFKRALQLPEAQQRRLDLLTEKMAQQGRKISEQMERYQREFDRQNPLPARRK